MELDPRDGGALLTEGFLKRSHLPPFSCKKLLNSGHRGIESRNWEREMGEENRGGQGGKGERRGSGGGRGGEDKSPTTGS